MLTATLLPQSCRPTRETPLERADASNLGLLLDIHSVEETAFHIKPELPHVREAPGYQLLLPGYELRVGVPGEHVRLARLFVDEQVGLGAIYRESASENVLPRRHGWIVRVEHEGVGIVGKLEKFSRFQ